jgi:hypothetical protein
MTSLFQRNPLLLTLATVLWLVPSARADELIGTYSINYRFSTAGCMDGLPNAYNPYLCPTQLPPGPFFITGQPAGRYRLVITGLGPNGGAGGWVWLGDASSGTYFPINDPIIVGNTTEFFHKGGTIVLYIHDWVPWDNDPLGWTDVALYRVVATLQSTLQDISRLRYQGLIDNAGVAQSLSAKIDAAQSAALRQNAAWRNQVEAFRREVQAQADKHIMGMAIQMLLWDADSLLGEAP